MDITKIQAAIADMPKQPVQGGKQYTMVAQRVEAFRKHIGADLGIETELISNTDQRVLMKAYIKTPAGFVVSTGYAEEIRNSTHINKGSALENCETSAVGRALAALGLHGGEYASVNEIEKHNRNMDAAHDQAVREEREAVASTDGVAKAPASLGGSTSFASTVSGPAQDIQLQNGEDPNAVGWQQWIKSIKNEIQGCSHTWQIRKIGQRENDYMRSLRQYNNHWADELKACIQVRWDQINNGER